jgi:peptide/nickel transport system ATP-binding protein
MSYLITQTFIFLLVAAFFGMVLGWYLTRISAAAERSSLEARLDTVRKESDQMRAERDAAVTAHDAVEHERRLLSDEMGDLRAELDAARSAPAPDDGDLAAVRAELEACRAELAVFTAPATANEQVADTAAIADAAAAAFAGVGTLMGGKKKGAAKAKGAAKTKGSADDLRKIKGIGPKIAGILNDLGIEQYAQIAAWTPADVEGINDHLKFKGRVEREGWIEQAKALLKEG